MSTPRDVRTLLSTSAPLKFKVSRPVQTEYPAPSVLEAVNDRLDPINARNGATVRVAYPGMVTSDTLAVAWLGSAERWGSEQKPGSAGGSVDFSVPASVVAASQGKIIEVLYAVVQAGKPGVPSLSLALTVGELAQTDLPMPAITQANPSTRTLDLNSFAGNASATVAAWPLIATGQRFWVRIDGTLENGSAHRFYAASAQAVTEAQVGQGLDVAALRTELEKLKHASELSVTVSVAFDGASNESLAKVFPVAAYTLEKAVVVTPTIDSVTDDKGTAVPRGGSTVSTTLTLSGQASAGQRVEILDGGTVLKTETVGPNRAWTSTLTGLAAKAYALKARALYGANPESEVWELTVQTRVCDNFSTARVGRYVDNQTHQLTSLLNCRPQIGVNASSANAQVVQVGAGRELQWRDVLSSEQVDWNLLTIVLRHPLSPLEKPLTVDIEFYVTDSNRRIMRLYTAWYLAGEKGKDIEVAVDAGKVSITIPAGAEPSHSTFPTFGGFNFLLHASEEHPGSRSSIIHVKSVCWSQ
ncbi:hypothetical protein F7234_12265 [Pseudomonas putida]|uniref:hypothetical protein n=1 Tax=Pseudomonas putida TaxID=303 RepID=UPI00125F209C|nr:hypothetical protein [Pseudomonas putida]KAB5623165.1 hypothetical protein F7234_12265 [Pseudomonas putida]